MMDGSPFLFGAEPSSIDAVDIKAAGPVLSTRTSPAMTDHRDVSVEA
jgi:hypothetical protein